MHLPPVTLSSAPSAAAFEQLAKNPSVPESEKVAEASRQFEAIFLRHILQQCRQTVFRSSLIDDSFNASVYQEMISAQLAESISQAGTFGVARALQAELGRSTQSVPAVEEPRTSETPLAPQKRLPENFNRSKI